MRALTPLLTRLVLLSPYNIGATNLVAQATAIEPAPELTVFYEDFTRFDRSEPIPRQWRGPGQGPNGQRYVNETLAWTLKPGGGVVISEDMPGVLEVRFPGPGQCSGAIGTDGNRACNGALITTFNPPLDGDLWIHWIDKLRERERVLVSGAKARNPACGRVGRPTNKS